MQLTLAALLFAAIAIAAPANQKRQLFPPPPNCDDTDLFLQCSTVNSIACANPLGLGTCYTACENCCEGDPNNELCAINGPAV